MLNSKYQSQKVAIASYDYTDIADQTGIVKFYGFAATDTSATTYKLNSNPFYSSLIEMTCEDDVEYDFDTSPFNAPAVIRGVATINYCIVSTNNAGTYAMAMSVKIRKWDGVTETEIANATAANHPKNTKKIYCLQISIPKTEFKKGEMIRITFTPAVTASGESAQIGVDPMNRDGTLIIPSSDSPITTTKIEANIPFDLDL